MKYFDTKSRNLTLVTDVKDDELVTETYEYPFFVKGLFVKRAIDLGAEFEENGNVVPSDLFEKISVFIVELYQNKFTKEELQDGIHANEIISVFISIIMSVLGREPKNESTVKSN